jgi:hypothetical protein
VLQALSGMRPYGDCRRSGMDGPGPGVRCQIVVKRTGSRCSPALSTKALNPNYLDRTVERQRYHVANAYQVARPGHALAVKPDITRFGERSSVTAGTHHARMPEPFIDALTVGGMSRGAQGRSLVLCSSCCLRAASLANGEFGSACLLEFFEPP